MSILSQVEFEYSLQKINSRIIFSIFDTIKCVISSAALFLYNESVIISSQTYNVFNIHIKYKVSRIQNIVWHDTNICYLSKQTGFYA